MQVILDILGNPAIRAAFLAWASAQALKVLLTLVISKRFDHSRVLGAGGMPSSHAAMVCALTTAIAIHDGVGSSIFALSFCVSCVVMYDAAGVRRSAGKSAAVLNHLVEDLVKNGFVLNEERLKELVGHTPIQVFAGALLGVLVGALVA